MNISTCIFVSRCFCNFSTYNICKSPFYDLFIINAACFLENEFYSSETTVFEKVIDVYHSFVGSHLISMNLKKNTNALFFPNVHFASRQAEHSNFFSGFQPQMFFI